MQNRRWVNRENNARYRGNVLALSTIFVDVVTRVIHSENSKRLWPNGLNMTFFVFNAHEVSPVRFDRRGSRVSRLIEEGDEGST